MISTLDLLYLTLALCAIIIAGVVLILGVQLFTVLQDVKRISDDVQRISGLLEKVSAIVFPGMERVAEQADRMERKVSGFLAKTLEKITK